jgi:hypothetical protein
MAFKSCWTLAVALLACGLPLAHGARPTLTDDARTVAPKSCQLETWVKRNLDSTEYWALPACNPTGNLELTFGGALTNEAGATRTSDVLIQAKTLFKTLEPNGWGVGLAAGRAGHPNETHGNGIGDLYAYVPASFSFRDDRLVIHTNVGWLRKQDDRRNRPTWGVGSELRITDRTGLIAETFQLDRGMPRFQTGVRHWIVRDRVQVDFTYGNDWASSREGRWFSLGLRLLSEPFLP